MHTTVIASPSLEAQKTASPPFCEHARPQENCLTIEIHAGNYPEDTEGGLLVGTQRGDDVVLHSRLALDLLLPKIQRAAAAGGICTIEIVEAPTTGEVIA